MWCGRPLCQEMTSRQQASRSVTETYVSCSSKTPVSCSSGFSMAWLFFFCQAKAALWLSSTGFLPQVLHCQTLESIDEGAPEFCIREGTGSGQLPIQEIDLALLAAQLLIFGSELLFHLLQPPT